jgi:VanZ family protein
MPDASLPAATSSVAARWTPPVLWVVVILVGTSWPRLSLGRDAAGLDKVAHFTAYAILAALSLRATLTPRHWRTLVAVVLSIAALGAVDEWHQSFIPGRSMSLLDWLADSSGAVVGTLAVRFIPFLTPRRPQLT